MHTMEKKNSVTSSVARIAELRNTPPSELGVREVEEVLSMMPLDSDDEGAHLDVLRVLRNGCLVDG